MADHEGSQPVAATTIAELISRLEALGYYKYADPDQIGQLKADSIEDGYPFSFETKREFPADGEDLAEGGVDDFLYDIQAFLDLQGVQLASVAQDFSADSYTVTVNGKSHLIYTEDELRRRVIWSTATVRCAMLVNELLLDAGSPERLYLLYAGGNEAIAVFLTPAMHEAISSSGLLESDEMPELLTEESLQLTAGVDLSRLYES